MKKLLPLIILVVAVLVVVVARKGGDTQSVEPIVWYGMMPHPYISEVNVGAQAAADDLGVPLLATIGQEWTQDNESSNVKALSTRGHKAFSIFPGDPAGANGLFGELKRNNQIVIAYGAEPDIPTPALFTVATDIKLAAMDSTEELIRLMGGKGNILNVLETVTDVNTKKRDDGVNEVANKYDGVNIIQTLSDMTQVSVAKEKIQSALAARGDEIDGIITTGYNPTIAAAAVLTEWHKNPDNKRIRFIGIDTGDTVLQAIRDGSIDATMAQNPYGHGYISITLLARILEGWVPQKEYQFVNAGHLVVNKDNIDTYVQDILKITESVLARVGTDLLTPPAE